MNRIDDRANFLNEQAKRLDEVYDSFLNGVRNFMIQIESIQHELIDAERAECRDAYDVRLFLLHNYISKKKKKKRSNLIFLK